MVRLIMERIKYMLEESNNKMLEVYWNVGRIIVENEQTGNIKVEYGKHLICVDFILFIQNNRHCLLN